MAKSHAKDLNAGNGAGNGRLQRPNELCRRMDIWKKALRKASDVVGALEYLIVRLALLGGVVIFLIIYLRRH